ncbi:NAD(P)/FAD-dependent oxidoreductase [Cecembia calidifontis]|uniref:Glycine/D-amino acid oxidase-like deaminating enzyme n=1 Tax=Cecembia calidifontis TaxID=1187080 RepID=A0A4Q7PD92_9BACT|nr:FAD-dependent oxidoreductase [Cecembia calidifontis]RZS98321.1 glycine/D-amino acid oxidase-like deaminating enzyme [Cecembia calidifontis]
MLSYWEKKNFLQYDLIVIGAGIVGLSVAIQYKERFPSRSVLVLERGLFPSGASTKNAGFACFGSLTEILDDLEVLPAQEVLGLVKRRYEGLLGIRNKFGDRQLDYKPFGGFELITEKEIHFLEKMDQVNALLHPIFEAKVFDLVDGYQSMGFGNGVKAIVQNAFEGELDSGKFLNALWDYCSELKIKILTGCEVLDLYPEEMRIEISTASNNPILFKSKQLAICTNAFTKSLLPELDIRPGRGLVMVTEPLKKEIPWKGSFHYDKGYVYFRNIDNRLLLGGGRNMDFQGEETVEFGINPKIRSYLLSIMEEIIFPDSTPQIEMEWSGIMAFGPDKRPLVQSPYPHIGIAVRLGGMGVAIGWQTAGELVNLLGSH